MEKSSYNDWVKRVDELVGFEGNVRNLAEELIKYGCEDIYYFDNWMDILNDGNVVADCDVYGNIHVNIEFEIVHSAGHNEVIKDTIIRITNVEVL
ncbi:MAG: hypothetical protein ABRQ27_05745 [Clostridiaceae bacterium]